MEYSLGQPLVSNTKLVADQYKTGGLWIDAHANTVSRPFLQSGTWDEVYSWELFSSCSGDLFRTENAII